MKYNSGVDTKYPNCKGQKYKIKKQKSKINNPNKIKNPGEIETETREA